MAAADLTGKALKTLLAEAFHGGKEKWAWFLNGGDPGIIGLLRGVSAVEASQPPSPGRKTIAAHAAHVLYHLQLISRLLDGEHDAFAPQLGRSWKQQNVDQARWRGLVDEMESLSTKWIASCEQVDITDEIVLTGSLASAVHFGYHLAAMRQILLSVRDNRGGGPSNSA